MTYIFDRRVVAMLALTGCTLIISCSESPGEKTSPQPAIETPASVAAPVLSTTEPMIERPTDTPESTAAGPTITILYDNTAYDERLAADWGFAALVEYTDFTLLFDTGGSGAILLKNMQELDIDPSDIDAIVISHEHGDHIGGLTLLLAQGIEPTIYLPSSFSQSTKSMASNHGQLVEVSKPMEIYPGLFTTGEMGSDIQEQALAIETNKGTVVLTGCSHPGIVEILHRVMEISEDDIHLVVGGFHLLRHSQSQIEAIIDEFLSLGVRQVAPAHCTGELAQSLFANVYGDRYSIGGAGRVFSDSP